MELVNIITNAEKKAVDSVETKTKQLEKAHTDKILSLRQEFDGKKKELVSQLQKDLDAEDKKQQDKVKRVEQKFKEARILPKQVSAHVDTLLQQL